MQLMEIYKWYIIEKLLESAIDFNSKFENLLKWQHD